MVIDFTQKTLVEKLLASSKPIVLYGMGNGADSIISELAVYGITISGVFVSDGFVRDKCFHGHKLYCYSDMKARYTDMVVLVAFGSSRPDVMDNIKRISAEQELYAPYVPVMGEGSFNREYALSNSDLFNTTYTKLADDLSHRTYRSILNYRYSGEVEHLFECETNVNEVFELLQLKNDEVYVDLGAYTGDTVAEFLNHTSGHEYIHAVEPNAKTFRKLEQNTVDVGRIKLYNAAAYNHSNGVSFSMRRGRSSSVGDSDRRIASVSVDEILDGNRASLIKMDIEGAEFYAIEGAKNTINRFKPKLRISCYHRIDDLFSIPKQVLAIRPDYNVYIRHMPYIPDWDTEFIFI